LIGDIYYAATQLISLRVRGAVVPGDKQDENLATIRMRKMTPAA
jgi:hypothetical protein